MLPGAVQPALAAGLGLDLAASGLVAAALSLGLGVGVLAGGPLADRLPRRPLFCAAAGLAGLAAVAPSIAPGFAAVLAATAGIGLGAGVFETLLNAAIPEREPATGAARLALLHAAATLGAALGAPLLGALAERSGFGVAYAALGAGFGAVAACGALVRLPAPRHAQAAAFPAPGVATLRSVIPFALVSFGYVGIETALSVFAPAYAASLGLGAERGMRGLSAFWLGLFAARVVFFFACGRASPRVIRVCAGLGAALLAGAAVLAGPPEAWLAAIGLALGLVFPVVVALAGDAAPAQRATAVGLAVGAGGLGGFVVPWAGGVLGDAAGAPAVLGGLALVAGAIAALGRGAAAAR